MHGNVWQWCKDKYTDKNRVLRGGSWISDASSCRSANRNAGHAGKRDNHNGNSVFGFRVVMHIP